MKQNHLQRIENFINEKHDGQDNQGIILLESEMETFGSSDLSEAGSNGGDCVNNDFGSCGSNGGDCQNSYGSCGGSTNRGDCYNEPKPLPMINTYFGCNQQ